MSPLFSSLPSAPCFVTAMEFGETELKSALYFMFNFNLKTLEDAG